MTLRTAGHVYRGDAEVSLQDFWGRTPLLEALTGGYTQSVSRQHFFMAQLLHSCEGDLGTAARTVDLEVSCPCANHHRIGQLGC